MKTKFNYKSKKTIIIGIIVLALIVISSIAVVAFLKGNESTEASGNNEIGNTINNNVNENIPSNNESEENNNITNENEEQPNEQDQVENVNNEQEAENNQNQGENQANENGENVAGNNNTQNAGENQANNNANANNQNQGNANQGNANQENLNQEFVTERTEVIPERVIAENYFVSWKPTQFATLINEEITFEKANIEAVKTVAKVTEEGLEKNPQSVKVGEELQYTITLTNTSEKVNGVVNVIDVIPLGTQFISATEENLITEPVNYDNPSEVTSLTWKNVKVEAGSKVELIVNVKVVKLADNEAVKTVKNVAIVYDGTTEENIPSEETKVANITSNKTSKIIYNQEKPHEHIVDNGIEPLHEQDIIEYTITLTNVGFGEGTVKVSDTVPEGTTLIKNGVVTVVDQNGETTCEMSEVVKGIDVTVPAGTETNAGIATVTFKVIVNSFEEETKTIRNNMAKVDETPTNTTEDTAEKLYIDIPASKIWANTASDAAKAYEITSIKLQVLGNNELVSEQVVTEQENWAHTFESLPKYDENGNEITYTVSEAVANAEDQEKLDKYIVSIDQETGVITNTFDVSKVTDTVDVPASKVWANTASDAAKEYEITSIKLQVLGNNELVSEQVVTAEEGWAHTFESLPKYDENGNEIIYTVSEAVAEDADQAKLDKYIVSIDQETGVITNTFDVSKVTDTVNIPASKVWENTESDAAKAYEITSIKLQVLANNELVSEQVVTEEENWAHTFENLPKYDANGNEIAYTVSEAVANAEDQEKLDKYIVSIDQETGIITNTFDPSKVTDTVNIPASKVWENTASDAAKAYEITSIKLQVLGNNELVSEQVVTAEEGWAHTFENLPKYDANGNEIIYTVSEAVANAEDQEKLDKYIVSIDQETGIITNTFDLNKVQDETIGLTVDKKWENIESEAAQDFALSSITIEVRVYSEDGSTYAVAARQEVTPDDSRNWIANFTELKKYDVNGNEIIYTVDEVVTDENDENKLAVYDKTIVKNTTNSFTITNTFNLNKVTETEDITITKIWEDNSNRYETRPNNIVLTLNGTNYTLNADNDEDSTTLDIWTLTIEDLPKYDAQGNKIAYTVTENNVPNGYRKVEDGSLTVTNIADVIVEKSVHKSNTDGSISSEVDGTEKFKAGDIIYYTLTFKNAGNTTIESKTLTDTVSLKLDLLGIGSITQLAEAEGEMTVTTGTDDYGYTWTITENSNGNKVVSWNLTNIEPGGMRQLLIKTRISAEVEYQEIHQKVGVETEHTATLYVRKDGKVPYNGSGLSDTSTDYTNSLGTVYLNSGTINYNTQENLTSNDIFYVLENNHHIVDMVSKGITREELKTALQNNRITLASDEIVLWYTIKSSNNEYKIYGVIRKITDPELSEITNAVYMDQTKHDETKIDLEEIIIAQSGTVTINVRSTTTENITVPMDVVLVLDVSGSMDGSNATKMVNAVNSSISTIMKEDPETRIGIVTFSDGSNVKTLIPLQKYTTSGNYLTLSSRYSTPRITENVTGRSNSVNIVGGTFTQAGIKAGAEMLTSQATTTFESTTQSGGAVSGTRIPVLILITDGEPTYYNNKADLSGQNKGIGSSTSAEHCYWTIRTAKHYKDAITTKYYGTTPQSEAKFFTIGIGMDGELATTTLNPNKTNVDALRYETDWWGNKQNASSNSDEMKLYNLLNSNGTPYEYDYANGSKTGALTENDLETFITTSLEASSGVTVVRAITDQETTNRRIDLTHIDTTEAFELEIIDQSTRTFSTLQEAIDANFVKQDATTGGYYVDLTSVTIDTTVNVSYWHVHT